MSEKQTKLPDEVIAALDNLAEACSANVGAQDAYEAALRVVGLAFRALATDAETALHTASHEAERAKAAESDRDFYKSREEAFLRALGPVADGGQYRADVVSRIEVLKKRMEKAEAFARECRDNFDCDPDAHRYGTLCRACEAAKVLGKGSP